MGALDEYIAEFLKPIRDLKKNFEVDIEEVLDKANFFIHYDGASCTLNFSQVAMLLQGASHIYAKKVDYLYDTSQALLTRLYTLTRSKRILTEVTDDAHESSSGCERLKKRFEDDFNVLPEFERGKDIYIKDNFSSKSHQDYIVTTPLALLESHGNVQKYKAPIFTLIGDLCEFIGYDEDFRVNRPISVQGMLCESIFDPAFDVPLFDGNDYEDTQDCSLMYTDGLHEEDILNNTYEDASINIAAQSSIFLSPQSLQDFPSCDNHHDLEGKVKKRKNSQKEDIFNIDEAEFAIPSRPIRKAKLKKSWVFPNNELLNELPERKVRKPLHGSEFYTECKKALPSVVGPSSPFSVPALELKEVKAPPQVGEVGNVNDESESDEQLDLPEHENGDDSAVTVGVDAHEMLFPAVSPPPSPHLPDPSTEDAPYDVIVQKRLSEVVAASKDYFEMSDLEARVRKWQEYLRPKLEEEARRPSFSLQNCLTYVLNQFSGQNVQTLGVHAVMQGLAERDISRMFLALLMLANKGVVMLSERKIGNQRVNEIDVSLTSTDIHALSTTSLNMNLTDLMPAKGDGPPPKKKKIK